MSRFGQFLVSTDLVTAEQLEDALGHQAVHGARLGTNLVELGAISIEQLAQALSDFHKVPLPQRKWIEKPQRAATQRATRSLVERIRFIPMRLEGKVLHAAVLDPRHPSVLDDLRFATGCRIQPYVMPEIWMHDWLLELFQLPRGIRHVQTRRTSKRPRQRSSDQPVYMPPNAPPAQFESNALPGTRTPVPPAAWSGKQSKPDAPHFEASWNDGVAPLDLPPLSRPPPVTSRERAPSVRPPPPSLAAAVSVRPPAVPLKLSLPPPVPSGRSVPPRAPGAAPRERGNEALPPLEQTSWSIATHASALSAATPHAQPAVPQPAAPQQAAAPQAVAPQAVAPQPAAPQPQAPPQMEAEPARDSVVFAEEPAAPKAKHAGDPSASVVQRTPPSVPAALELTRYEAQMLDAGHRDRLIHLALTIAGSFAARVALFTVHQGMLQAQRIENGVIVPVDGMLLPVETPCMLTEVVAKNEPMRAQAQNRPIDMQVLELIGDTDSDSIALFPVSIKNRVVNVLFASNGLDPVGEIAFAALARLAQQMGVAYGRLILSRKAAGGG